MKTFAELPASPFEAPWIRSLWHARITVEPAPEECRVWGRVLEGPCWLYHGSTNGKGHSRVRIKGRLQYLHRHSLASFHGMEIWQLDTVDHLCRRRNCFQPFHVEDVTMLENYLRGEGPNQTATQFKPTEAYINPDDEDLEKALRGY